jgi:hypothetical protein
LFALLVGVLVGCEALAAPDPSAGMGVELTAYVSEATSIAQSLAAQGTAVVVTAQSAATYIVQQDGINRQVVATLRAGLPPTAQVVLGADPSVGATPPIGESMLDGGAGASAPAASVEGGFTEFQPPQTASAVRSSDDCAEVVTTEFSSASPIIYVTTRAFNMRAGTQMAVEWLLSGQVVYNFNFAVPVDDPDYCLWFSITPADVPFTPGDWSVRLLANGAPILPTASFVIIDGM